MGSVKMRKKNKNMVLYEESLSLEGNENGIFFVLYSLSSFKKTEDFLNFCRHCTISDEP